MVSLPISPDTRRGLNCTLSYPGTRSGKAVNVGYRLRCNAVMYGFTQISDESQGRTTRAFYPRRTAPTQFAIAVDLIGQAERNSLNSYLMAYADYILDPGISAQRTPQMTVTVPSRNFQRIGTPIGGVTYGTQIGAITYPTTITFEISGEPIDWNDTFAISSIQADLAFFKTPDSNYFYPTGTQLKGGDAPTTPGAIGYTPQEAINGAPASDGADTSNATNFGAQTD